MRPARSPFSLHSGAPTLFLSGAPPLFPSCALAHLPSFLPALWRTATRFFLHSGARDHRRQVLRAVWRTKLSLLRSLTLVRCFLLPQYAQHQRVMERHGLQMWRCRTLAALRGLQVSVVVVLLSRTCLPPFWHGSFAAPGRLGLFWVQLFSLSLFAFFGLFWWWLSHACAAVALLACLLAPPLLRALCIFSSLSCAPSLSFSLHLHCIDSAVSLRVALLPLTLSFLPAAGGGGARGGNVRMPDAGLSAGAGPCMWQESTLAFFFVCWVAGGAHGELGEREEGRERNKKRID